MLPPNKPLHHGVAQRTSPQLAYCAEAFSGRERRLHGFGVVAMEPRRKPRGGKELIPRSLPPSHAFTQSLPRSFITTLPPRLEELDRATSELPESYGVQKFLADQQRAT